MNSWPAPARILFGLAEAYETPSGEALITRSNSRDKSRQELLTFVRNNPGHCAYELSEMTNISLGYIRHLLNELLDQGKIYRTKGTFFHYWPAQRLDKPPADML